MMKARENLIKNRNNGLMRSFLTDMKDESEETSAVADLREVVFDIKTGQANEKPKISDFIIEYSGLLKIRTGMCSDFW